MCPTTKRRWRSAPNANALGLRLKYGTWKDWSAVSDHRSLGLEITKVSISAIHRRPVLPGPPVGSGKFITFAMIVHLLKRDTGRLSGADCPPNRAPSHGVPSSHPAQLKSRLLQSNTTPSSGRRT